MNLATWLIEKDACKQGRDWARNKTPEEAWSTCERGDWLLWAWAYCVKKDSPEHRRLVACACEIARSVLHLAKSPAVLQCIETTEAWTRGEATLEQVRASYAAEAAYYAAEAARAGAYAAAYYAAEAAYYAAEAARSADAARAADRAASYASDAAAAAAAADVAAEAARAEALAKYADVVRKYQPTPPEFPKGDKPCPV